MSVLFNPAEIFEIAVQIERNGAQFYRKAAETAPDAETRRILNELADMEEGHIRRFQELRDALAGKDEPVEWFSKDNEAWQYMESFTSGQVFDMLRESSLGKDAGLREILEFAMERERDSIVFYLGMKEWVPRELAGNKIQSIIIEEMQHVAILNKRRAQLLQKA